MPPLRCCGGKVPFLQVVLPVLANRVGSKMWLCHCASGLASCLCAASRTLHYCSLNDGCYQAVLPAVLRFSGYGWVSGLEGLSQRQEVSQFALVYCVLCKSTVAAGLRAAMSDKWQLQKNAIYPKPCSRCALLGWLHHPNKSLTWLSEDECSSYAHRRACECLSWAQRCGGSALMWLLWDLRQFLVKFHICLSHVCPLLWKSPALTSADSRKDQVRNSPAISAFILEV